MFLTDQDVPPQFATQLAQLVSSTPGAIAGELVARTRRRARQSLRYEPPRAQLMDVITACEFLANALGYEEGSRARSDFRYDQTRRILSGAFDPLYWIVQDSRAERAITYAPSSIIDPSPPPYSYRVSSNLPTIPTYSTGTLDTEPARYRGQTIGDYFYDVQSVAERSVFTLDTELTHPGDAPVFMHLASTLVIDTDQRGSRPMLSLLVARQWGSEGALQPFDDIAIHRGAWSFYWRYRTPAGEAPYYHMAHDRTLVHRIVPPAASFGGGPLQDLALSICPRPMFGRGFNNNRLISIDQTNTLRVRQIDSQATRRTPGLCFSQYRTRPDTSMTTAWLTLTPTRGTTFRTLGTAYLATLPPVNIDSSPYIIISGPTLIQTSGRTAVWYRFGPRSPGAFPPFDALMRAIDYP